MDATASSFSTRSNAKRAAEQMIAKGTAPTVDYGIKPSNGRFEVVWKTALTAPEFAETAEAQTNQASKAEGEDWPIKPSNGRFEVVWKTALTAPEFAETAEAQTNQASKAEGEDWPNTA